MHESDRLNDHQKFKEMAALAQARVLTAGERIELKRHLQMCETCRAVAGEYSLLSSEGMAFLAAEYGRVSDRLANRAGFYEPAAVPSAVRRPIIESAGKGPGALRQREALQPGGGTTAHRRPQVQTPDPGF